MSIYFVTINRTDNLFRLRERIINAVKWRMNIQNVSESRVSFEILRNIPMKARSSRSSPRYQFSTLPNQFPSVNYTGSSQAVQKHFAPTSIDRQLQITPRSREPSKNTLIPKSNYPNREFHSNLVIHSPAPFRASLSRT